MSAERATYLDASALVKLANEEVESAPLRRYLRTRRWLVTSALTRTEVARALIPLGETIRRRGQEALSRCEIVRVNDRILNRAGALTPVDLRSLDAIHLTTAETLAEDLGRVVTYDARMAAGAKALGLAVSAPA